MPIYEYRCEACGHETDELQKLTDAPLVDCPKCAQPRLLKLVSAAGFQLKGTGWYQTDFRTKKTDKKSDAAAPAADGAASTPTASDKPTGGDTATVSEKPASAAKPALKEGAA